MRTVILIQICIGVAIAASQPATLSGDAGICNFSGIDLYQKIVDIVKELPPEYSQPDRKPEEVVPGVFLGTIVYTGLDNLKPYGPVFSYCRNGTRFVQIDLATDGHLMQAFTPWKTCGGQKGAIGTYAAARVTVTFEVKYSGRFLLRLFRKLGLCEQDQREGDDCDFSDVNAEQMVTNVLSNLPASYTEPDLKPEQLFLGISLGPPSIKNADIFELYGPVSTYCRNGAKLVQVDIVADRPMEFSAPWKICTGKEGTVGLYGTARVTVTFEVTD
ncbi:hypothetical protein HPB50_026899 [Hyalomma asiaticum]|uniref:Uncharacterized protein n=1 Tax=Hyalomma asiaticum TaxID=266040 RepID=A0ACB7RZ78_HYAAI|nr:hypothetical protein HPB50_026899 [Hyalomma asiaticum]